MKCEECMERFLELEGGSPMGGVAEHIASCPRCAEEVRRINAAFAVLAEDGLRKPDRDLTEDVMSALTTDSLRAASRNQQEDDENPLRNWIWSGAIIFVGVMLIPFSTILPALSGRYGSSLDIMLHLILGSVIASYGTLFIISHMGLLRKIVLRLENLGLRK